MPERERWTPEAKLMGRLCAAIGVLGGAVAYEGEGWAGTVTAVVAVVVLSLLAYSWTVRRG